MTRTEGYYWVRWGVGTPWSICEVREPLNDHDGQRFYECGLDDRMDAPTEWGPRLVPPDQVQDPELAVIAHSIRRVYKALRWPRTADGAEALGRTCMATIAELKHVSVILDFEGDVVRFETHGGIEGTVTL